MQLTYPIIGQTKQNSNNNQGNKNNQGSQGNSSGNNNQNNQFIILQRKKEQVIRKNNKQRTQKQRVNQAVRKGVSAKTEIILNPNNTKTIVVGNRRNVVIPRVQKGNKFSYKLLEWFIVGEIARLRIREVTEVLLLVLSN